MKETIQETRERYISLLKGFYKEHGRSPGRRDFVSKYTMFVKTFGSWNGALSAAGLPVNKRKYQVADREGMIKSLIAFFEKHGRPPRANDCRAVNGLADHKTYYSVLGVKGWAEVLKLAGLDPYFEVSELASDKPLARCLCRQVR